MKGKWIAVLGAAVLTVSVANLAQADHLRGVPYGYGYGYSGYRYPAYGYSVYHAPSYGYFNRTDHYHYTHPRVTTGYGFRSHGFYPHHHHSYRGHGYYGGRGRVSVYGSWGGVDVRW